MSRILKSYLKASLEDFILNNVKPVVSLENDISVVDYVLSDDAFFTKFNAMTYDFSMFDVHSNGNMNTLDYIFSISHVNSIDTEPFNIDDNELPKEM